MVSTGIPAGSPSRRSVLAGVAVTAGTAWFVDRVQPLSRRSGGTRVGFQIKTLPADEDPYGILVSRQLAAWFREAGIDASVLPVTGEELLRQVLYANDYDVFVTQYPGSVTDPDVLYSLVHSDYAAEPGWQNPFGYSSLSTDELLERQRTVDRERRGDVAATLQETLLEQNPFTVLAFPDRITALREERFQGISGADLRQPRAYYSLERRDDEARTLRVTTTDPRVTTNLNPLNPEYRQDGLITGLLYEPIAYRGTGGLVPWLGADLTWVDGENPAVRVAIRDGAIWHDGEDLTAEDVAFTYAFMQDTSLGELEEPVPVTRYRGRSALVEGVDVRDDATATIDFGAYTRDVARRALTVPVLPEHVWRDRASETTSGGGPGSTRAIVTDNVPAVGSGPLAFERATARERLVLERFDDHVTRQQSDADLPAEFTDGLQFDELVVRFVGSDASAVDLVASEDTDATVANVGPDIVPQIGRAEDVSLATTGSRSFFFAGFNARRPPFSNARFRTLVGRLIDRAAIAEDVFEGYATPAVSPLAGTEWLPPSLEWDGSDPSFLGEDGSLTPGRVRDAFTDAGYRFDEEGRMYRH